MYKCTGTKVKNVNITPSSVYGTSLMKKKKKKRQNYIWFCLCSFFPVLWVLLAFCRLTQRKLKALGYMLESDEQIISGYEKNMFKF